MKQNMDSQKLHCIITNSQGLKIGINPEHVFDNKGGTIGSGEHANWKLSSDQHKILEKHCSIVVLDQQYCLIDHSGKVFINYSHSPVKIDTPIALGVEDLITIGGYHIKFQAFSNKENDPLLFHKQSLNSMFADELGENIIPENNSETIDPLSALDVQDRKTSSAPSHSAYHLDSVVGAHEIDYSNIDYSPSTGVGQSQNSHFILAPIIKGLEAKLNTNLSSTEMQYIAEEVGASLKEVVAGLLKLHEQAKKINHNSTEKIFQPIIDNPLKMGLSYEETINLMFDSKASLVHLAAPAAIKESLELIANHQKATEYAVNVALEKILEALSPERLTERFNYYRAARNLPIEDKESWAWKMYQAYYQELTSSRQTGFNKLFWEIFEQSYDKEIRDLQK